LSREGTGHRAVDLARMAGISTQQIRNYADAGILPPVSRTAAGYRRFDESHRQALLAYRALARGCGPHTARAIMHAVHAGDVPRALALIDSAHAALHEQRRSLLATREALEAMAGHSPDTPTPRTPLRIGELAARLGVRTSALRTWESAGLLTPGREPGTGYRRFGPADVRDAQAVLTLRQAYYSLPSIRPIIDDLRRSGSTEALRAAVAERNTALTRQATAMLEGAAQLHRYLEAAGQIGPAMSTNRL
jgi:DNA-binding transcriptional MerR regulator